MKTLRYEILNYLRTGLANITAANGYNNTMQEVISNLKNTNDQVALPCVIYKVLNESREPKNNDHTVFDCSLDIIIGGYKDANLDIANSGYDFKAAEELIEDLLAYFEAGDWITAGKTCGLAGNKFAAQSGTYYGQVKSAQVYEILEPSYSESKIEVIIKLKVLYHQKLS